MNIAILQQLFEEYSKLPYITCCESNIPKKWIHKIKF